MTDLQFALLCLTVLVAMFAGRVRELAQFVQAVRSRDGVTENDSETANDESENLRNLSRISRNSVCRDD